MNITVPFSKEIPFKSNIAEISSISLEEDVSINDNEILGDFLVSGEYKNLDINVDLLPFNHVVPFSVELSSDIDINSLKYEVQDFTYEVLNNDTLKVNVLFHVEADKLRNEKQEIFIKDDTINETILDEILDEEVNDDNRVEIDEIIKEDNNVTQDNNEERDEENKNTDILINNDLEKDYITYHVHIVKLNETIESISKEYNISKEELCDLNDITNISIGDKLIIPDKDEE